MIYDRSSIPFDQERVFRLKILVTRTWTFQKRIWKSSCNLQESQSSNLIRRTLGKSFHFEIFVVFDCKSHVDPCRWKTFLRSSPSLSNEDLQFWVKHFDEKEDSLSANQLWRSFLFLKTKRGIQIECRNRFACDRAIVFYGSRFVNC